MRKGRTERAAKPINDPAYSVGAVGGGWASSGPVNWLTCCIFGYSIGPGNVFPNRCGWLYDVVVFR
jgi:hypothetical protein